MLLRRLIEILAPASCVGCGREGELACQMCLAAVSVRPGRCFACNVVSEAGLTCGMCRPASLEGVAVAADYEGVVKELVWRLKFERERVAAAVLADLVAERLDYDPMVVTAVPVAPVRYRERGYNQSELIARGVARRLGRPYLPMLGRSNTQHQTGRTRAERLAQIQGVFYPTRRLAGERVLVVDDVITTGATLAECGRVLREIGASEVRGAVAARK